MMENRATSCFVVDDDPDLRRLIAHSARKTGFAIVECGHLGEVEEALGRARPQLIFLDVGLENSDASQVLEVLAERQCNAWVQLVSGRSADELEKLEIVGEDLGLNMLPALTKPFRAGAIRTIAGQVHDQDRDAAQ